MTIKWTSLYLIVLGLSYPLFAQQSQPRKKATGQKILPISSARLMPLIYDGEVAMEVKPISNGVSITLTSSKQSKVKELRSVAAQVAKNKNDPRVATIWPRDRWSKDMKGMRHGMAKGWLMRPSKATKQSIDRGRVLYEAYCQNCHGKKGRGDGFDAKDLDLKPADLAAIASRYPNHHFYLQISQGSQTMPAWKDIFYEEDIWHLTNYIRSLSQ